MHHGKRRNQDRYPVPNIRSKVLYVGNLNFDSEEQDIDKFFQGYGQINDIRIKQDHGGKRLGYAYVEFNYPEDAKDAM